MLKILSTYLLYSLWFTGFGQVYMPDIDEYDTAYFKNIVGDNALSITPVTTNRIKRSRHFKQFFLKGQYKLVFNKKLNYPVDIICRIENNDREGIIVKENSSGIDFTIPSNRELTLTFDLKKDLGDKNEVVGIFYYLYDAYFKRRAEKFAFTDIHGEKYTNDTLFGKLTVLYFFNTGIREPSSSLNKVVEKYAYSKDIKFFAISGNSENDLRHYALKNNFKYSLVANNGGMITSFSYKSMITMPQHVIIDRNGDIVFWHLGDNHDIYRLLTENIDKHL